MAEVNEYEFEEINADGTTTKRLMREILRLSLEGTTLAERIANVDMTEVNSLWIDTKTCEVFTRDSLGGELKLLGKL